MALVCVEVKTLVSQARRAYHATIVVRKTITYSFNKVWQQPVIGTSSSPFFFKNHQIIQLEVYFKKGTQTQFFYWLLSASKKFGQSFRITSGSHIYES